MGTAQLDLDGMPSKRHHAEVSKVLVDLRYRRTGVARALMADMERRASEAGRWLLTLDTAGDAAETLHRSRATNSPERSRYYARDALRGGSLRRDADHVQGFEVRVAGRVYSAGSLGRYFPQVRRGLVSPSSALLASTGLRAPRCGMGIQPPQPAPLLFIRTLATIACGKAEGVVCCFPCPSRRTRMPGARRACPCSTHLTARLRRPASTADPH